MPRYPLQSLLINIYTSSDEAGVSCVYLPNVFVLHCYLWIGYKFMEEDRDCSLNLNNVCMGVRESVVACIIFYLDYLNLFWRNSAFE